MSRSVQSRWLRAAAIAAVTGLSAAISSFGQVRVSQDGHALDANNRVGSNGYNGSVGGSGVTPNQIIYGNVTGGKEFRGPVFERDPGAFMGPSPSEFTDQFIAGSSAAPQPYQPAFSLSTPQPFYGGARDVAPPVGTVREGYTGSYLGAGLTPQPGFGASEYNTAFNYQAQRLGESSVLGTQSTRQGGPEGELFLNGPQQGADLTMTGGSALYGVQSFSLAPDQANNVNGPQQGAGSMLNGSAADRFRYDTAEMRQMRSELQGSANPPQTLNGQPQNSSSNPGQQSSLSAPFEAPNNSSLTAPPLNGLNSQTANSLQTGSQYRTNSTLIAPGLQSSQYNELQRRFEQYQNPQMAALQAAHEANLERNSSAAAGGAKAGGTTAGGPTSRPSLGYVITPPGRERTGAEAPMHITSLAAGIRAKGLHDLMSSAENLMRQGKFESAIERYNTAGQIASNNPLIPLGRANAELGAGAYQQASADLHKVFLNDPATLMARYDLASWIPEKRMTDLVKELQGLSKAEHDEMPPFLLGYIAYNRGHSKEAADELAEAQRRSQGTDPLLSILRRDWRLPAQSESDMNK